MSAFPERIGPYIITGKLGEGGMGVVYRAKDTRLNRPVALKMILDSGEDEDSRKRFLREAQAAARVTHPNICRLYDIGELDGRPYLVMELLEGESISERLQRGPLPLEEALQVMLGILSALAALHRSSIVHRDLKPSNVFLSTQGVKLLDFGLAKPISPLSDDGRTQTELTGRGIIAGTPRYSSPEQIKGGLVDARSDLFAAAVILFEALTGKPAFSGNSALEVFHSVLYETPPAMSGSQAISAVDRVARRAMDKNPANRFTSADEMAADLRAVMSMDNSGSHVQARAMKRLIVLPFRVLRSDPETDFLAFSLPDAIGASLAGLSSLVVRSSLAAARFAGPSLDLREIAKEIDIDTVLTGTLLRAGSQVRLTTQLIEAPGGTLIWSKESQVELRDIFQLQDTLVSGVVESLALPLTAGERQQLAHDAPANAAAYDLYLRANEAGKEFKGLPEAIRLYEQCVALDPGYAPAWARLGRARWLIGKFSGGTVLGGNEKLVEGRKAVERALELNPDLPLAHNLYTNIQVDQGHTIDALKRLLKRLRSSKTDPELFAGLTHASRYCGLLQASVAAHREARRLDPNIRTTVAHTYFAMGDYQAALEEGRQDFGYFTPLRLAMLGRVEEAIAMLKEKELGVHERLGKIFMLGLRTLLEGNREGSLKACEERVKEGFQDPEGKFYMARQLSYLGETATSIALLKTAIDNGYLCYPQLASDPWLDPIRGDAEFKEILHRAEALHQEAIAVFKAEGGPALLGQA
jgi:serine/threonine protein kinase/tetratricopeptide (TPR) repeat protein